MKNVILISIDNLRFDCIGYQPNKKELVKYDLYLNTPILDSIAKNSICFTNAISTNTYTTSSHASIITGLYPPRHGLRAFNDRLSDDVKTLAEIFRDKDYLTILATDWLYAWKLNDLHRGFDYIFDRKDKELYKFLDIHKGDKIFLLIHFLDVHEPYLYAEQKINEDYNVDYIDEMYKLCDEYNLDNLDRSNDKVYDIWRKFCNKIKRDKRILFPLFVKGVNKFDNGRFKEFIKFLNGSDYIENSLMVIFSDHGEGRFLEEDANSFSHAGALYDDVLRVPLMIYNNGIGHKIIDSLVSTVDIFPTILNFCFGDTNCCSDGKNLLIEDRKDNEMTYSEVWRYHSNDRILYQRCIRNKHRKYIIYNNPEICQDISILNDPIEEFIKKLYMGILGRLPDEQGLENWLKKAYIDNISKKEIMYAFLNCEESRTKRFIMLDLDKDDGELFPFDPTINIINSIEYFENIKQIMGLEKLSIRSVFDDGKKYFNISQEDDARIKKRLEELGYL